MSRKNENVTQDSQDSQNPIDTQETQDTKRYSQGEIEQKKKWTFAEYVAMAYQQAKEEEEDRDYEEWVSPLWCFTRKMTVYRGKYTPKEVFKGIENVLLTWTSEKEMADFLISERGMEQNEAAKAVRSAIDNKRLAPGVDLWEIHFCLSRDEAEVEFLSNWEVVRFPPGFDPLEYAKTQAEKHPVQIRNTEKESRPDIYPFFISIAFWLQVTMGEQPVMLPCRKVGELLGVSHETIFRLRRNAEEDKYITKVKEHNYRSQGNSEATEYTVDISLWSNMQKFVKSSRRGT
jgi:hypothetical protein